MKAIVHERYGPPEVARLKEIPKPIPKPNEVLVQTAYSTINRTDAGFRSANYVVSRLVSGLFRPKRTTLGCEFSGMVAEIGDRVNLFKPGDKVFGYNDQLFGGHAEFLCLPQNSAIAPLPLGMDFKESAALTEGAHYALCNIRAAKVKAGDWVMVYGATGAIGSAAVQLLVHLGARVCAVCGTAQTELIKNLGAEQVLDYQKEDFRKSNQLYSFVFDAVGKSSFADCKALLAPKGIYISTELGKFGANVFLALWTPIWGGKKVLFPIPSMRLEDLMYLHRLAEEGSFKPIIDRCYRMEEIEAAYRYVESGQKIGNVLLHIQDI